MDDEASDNMGWKSGGHFFQVTRPLPARSSTTEHGAISIGFDLGRLVRRGGTD
jgi:hypothetical protein